MANIAGAFEAVDNYIAQRMRQVNIPGLALGITDRSRVLKVGTYGFANVDSRYPVQPGTVFEIGSIGKSFTNVALMQLHDEGALDLQAPVSSYLPWFDVKSDHGPITTHHLMTHTSGLPSGTDIGSHGLYEAWALRDTQVRVPPGEYFRYSNVGYKTLGFLLEELDGRSYQDSIQSRVLDPLGMYDSHPVIGYETRKRAAVGYRSFYDDRPEHVDHGLAPAMWTEYGVGDGCQASTASDMAIYLRMFMNGGFGPSGRLMSEDSFRLMTQRAIATAQWGGAHYGYALTLADIDGHAYLGHGGSTTGFVAAMIADLNEGIGVVILINGLVQSFGAVDMALSVIGTLRARLHGGEIPAMPASTDPEATINASDYAGTYRAGEEQLEVFAKGNRLSLLWGGQEIVLQPRGDDRFYVRHPELEEYLLEFGRENGRVVEAFHGPDWYVGEGYSEPASFDYPAEWDSFKGHYRTYNFGLTNFRIVVRKGSLLLAYPQGGNDPLVPIGDGQFRIGDDPRSAETVRFDAVASGRALRATYSGCPYYRTYTP